MNGRAWSKNRYKRSPFQNRPPFCVDRSKGLRLMLGSGFHNHNRVLTEIIFHKGV